MTSDKVVVVAYDGSPAARRAVTEAAKVIGPSRLVVVTVWEEGLAYEVESMPPDGMIATPMISPKVAYDVDREVHGHAERVAQEGVELANSVGLEAVPLAIPDHIGIARTILDGAREQQAVAIIVGSRGLGGIRARLEGSTSKALLKHAFCPVLVVHDEHPDQSD